jgi:hypothetical protein
MLLQTMFSIAGGWLRGLSIMEGTTTYVRLFYLLLLSIQNDT